MLHLLLLNHFLFMASKNFLVKSATRSAFTVPFGQASLVFFLLLHAQTFQSEERCAVCACLCACACACSRKSVCSLTYSFCLRMLLFSSPGACCFLQTWAKKQAVAPKAGSPFSGGLQVFRGKILPIAFKCLRAFLQIRVSDCFLPLKTVKQFLLVCCPVSQMWKARCEEQEGSTKRKIALSCIVDGSHESPSHTYSHVL